MLTGDSAGGDGPLRFVEGLFVDRVQEALVREDGDERVEPSLEEDVRKIAKDSKEVRFSVLHEDGFREGAENFKGCFRNDKRLEIADREELEDF